MAEIAISAAAAFGNQSDFGIANINTTIRDLASSIALSDGLVLGDRSAGVNESGISVTIDRSLIEKVRIGKTNQASDFVEISPGALAFAFPMAGPKRTTTATPIDTDFRHETDVGVESILRACGLVGVADPVGVGWLYKPADSIPMTMKVWIAGVDYVFFDVIGDLVISYQGGEVPVAVATLAGKIQAIGVDAIPTLDFGVQSSVGSPTTSSIGFTWDAAKGPVDSWSLSIINNLEEIIDSNQPGGKKTRQVSRDIDIAITMMADSSDGDFELTELQLTSLTAANLTYTVGTPETTGSLPAVAHKVIMDHPEIRSVEPTVVGGQLANIVTARAVDTTAGDELDLLFL